VNSEQNQHAIAIFMQNLKLRPL